MSTLRNREKRHTNEPKVSNNEVSIDDLDNDESGFSFFDIIRMIGGFILLNLVISQIFTGTLDYGYSSLPMASPIKSPVKYFKYNYFYDPTLFTNEELALYNGTSADLPIYVSLNGTVYDVTHRRKLYAPGGSYSFFGGKECSFALATNCLNYKGGIIVDDEKVELEPEEIRRVKAWIEFYDDRYFAIGRVVDSTIEDRTKKGLKFSDREVCIGKY